MLEIERIDFWGQTKMNNFAQDVKSSNIVDLVKPYWHVDKVPNLTLCQEIKNKKKK